MVNEEKKLGLYSSIKLKKFKLKILSHINQLQKLLENLKKKQNKITLNKTLMYIIKLLNDNNIMNWFSG